MGVSPVKYRRTSSLRVWGVVRMADTARTVVLWKNARRFRRQ